MNPFFLPSCRLNLLGHNDSQASGDVLCPEVVLAVQSVASGPEGKENSYQISSAARFGHNIQLYDSESIF